jgi:hypothetical protein
MRNRYNIRVYTSFNYEIYYINNYIFQSKFGRARYIRGRIFGIDINRKYARGE